MNFGNLKTMARGIIPQAKQSVISNTVSDLILNEGANKVAEKLLCLPTNAYFNVVAEQQEYDLSSVVDRYLVAEDLYWYDSANWKHLYARTREYLNKKFVYWRDDSSGDPLRFFIDNHKLIIHPKPDTAGTSYFRLYYFEGTQTMTTNSHYPMGHDTEIVRLRGLSDAILFYWRVQALKIIGKAKSDEIAIAEKDFDSEIKKQRLILNRVPYLINDNKTRFKGEIVC